MGYLSDIAKKNLAAWHKAREHKRFRRMSAWTKVDGGIIHLWSYYKRVACIAPETRRVYLDTNYWDCSPTTYRQIQVFLKTYAPDLDICKSEIRHGFTVSKNPQNSFTHNGYEIVELDLL